MKKHKNRCHLFTHGDHTENVVRSGLNSLIVAVDSSNDGTAALVAAELPEVRFLIFPERKYPGDARNIGIVVVRAEINAKHQPNYLYTA